MATAATVKMPITTIVKERPVIDSDLLLAFRAQTNKEIAAGSEQVMADNANDAAKLTTQRLLLEFGKLTTQDQAVEKPLTPRQLKIVHLIATRDGLGGYLENGQIGEALNEYYATVFTNIGREIRDILKKLGVSRGRLHTKEVANLTKDYRVLNERFAFQAYPHDFIL